MGRKQKTVLVTGVGGNVGQGVLRNLRVFCPELRLVGTDIAVVTAGHYFLDAYYTVPYCYEETFAPLIQQICAQEQVDLVIPTTDYEVYYLGMLVDRLPLVLVSAPDVSRIFLDKYLTFQEFSRFGLPFPATYLPSEFSGQLEKVLVKPREGRGSRDIHIQPKQPAAFDDRYIVQDLLQGEELTTAFYVRKDGALHGMMTFSRKLASGMTERCEVVSRFNAQLEQLVRQLIGHLAVRGPCNLQSIATDSGAIVPFEVNCRYSGTNSIRAQLGFRDVYYGIQEYLYGAEPSPCVVVPGSAVRIFMDIVYPQTALDAVKPGKNGAILF